MLRTRALPLAKSIARPVRISVLQPSHTADLDEYSSVSQIQQTQRRGYAAGGAGGSSSKQYEDSQVCVATDLVSFRSPSRPRTCWYREYFTILGPPLQSHRELTPRVFPYQAGLAGYVYMDRCRFLAATIGRSVILTTSFSP